VARPQRHTDFRVEESDQTVPGRPAWRAGGRPTPQRPL